MFVMYRLKLIIYYAFFAFYNFVTSLEHVPAVGGYRYHNLGQSSPYVSHYSTGWPHQTYREPLLINGMQFRDPYNTEVRTLGYLRPPLYSQYQSVIPQTYTYSTRVHQVPFPEYHTHFVSGLSHYPSYSPYPSNAQTEKFRIIDKNYNSGQFDTKYQRQKSAVFTGTSHHTQPPMIGSIPPTFNRGIGFPAGESHRVEVPSMKKSDDEVNFKIIPESFGYVPLKKIRERVSPGNKHQMLIPYKAFPHLPPIEMSHLTWFTLPVQNRNAEDVKSMESNPQFRGIRSSSNSEPRLGKKDEDELEKDFAYETLTELSKYANVESAESKTGGSLLKSERNEGNPKVSMFEKKNEKSSRMKDDQMVGAIFSASMYPHSRHAYEFF